MHASSRLRSRQWSRAAWALAALFASLPVSSRLFLGVWGFDTAAEMAALCLVVALYLDVRSRKTAGTLADDAELLGDALQLLRAGETSRGEALLTEALRRSPRLWQALQYRGELYLSFNDLERARRDFDEAIRIQPGEAHLYALRGHTHHLLGNENSAREDLAMVHHLSGTLTPPVSL